MNVLVEIKELDHNLKPIEDAIKAIRELDVLVGVPQEKSSRDGTVSNAELAFIHSKGSPLRGIPARPIIEPAIEDSKEQIAELIKKSAQKALDGDKEGAIESLEKAGMQGQNIVRAWFTSPRNNWPKLSKETIDARRRRMTKKEREKADSMIEATKDKDGNVDTSVAFKPLIDTDELRKSITYVVRKRVK